MQQSLIRNGDDCVDTLAQFTQALIRLLHSIIRIAGRRGKPVAVCGEMAGDALYAPLLLALGLSELSLHPNTLLELRRAIRNSDLAALRARAPALLRARDRASIEAWVHASTPRG